MEARLLTTRLMTHMRQQGRWQNVLLDPGTEIGAEVILHGSILAVNPDLVALAITAVDARGTQWFRKQYRQQLTRPTMPADNEDLLAERFVSLFHGISADLASHERQLTAAERHAIRLCAAELYVTAVLPDHRGGCTDREPSEPTPSLSLDERNSALPGRLEPIRFQELLFLGVRNDYYTIYSDELWAPYLRALGSEEQDLAGLAIREEQALRQMMSGIDAIAGAIAQAAADITGDDDDSSRRRAPFRQSADAGIAAAEDHSIDWLVTLRRIAPVVGDRALDPEPKFIDTPGVDHPPSQ